MAVSSTLQHQAMSSQRCSSCRYYGSSARLCLFLFTLGTLTSSVQAAVSAAERPPAAPTLRDTSLASRLSNLFQEKRTEIEGNSPLLVESFSNVDGGGNHNQVLSTRAGALAKSFEPVLDGRSDVDTLRLLRACRKFEFLMREIGQRQVAKDMEGNIRKVLQQYYNAPPHRRKTVSELLDYEKTLGIHGKHGQLKDPSAAMGLLWIRRSLAFQSRMYKLLLEPGMDPTEAALAAYRSELQPYHGFALQRLYSFSLQTATQSRQQVLAKIGGFENSHFGHDEEVATLNDLHNLVDIWKPIIARCRHVHLALDMEDKRRV